MDYEESSAYIESLMPGSQRPGLERFARFMNYFGNPQNECPSLHVGGTNGKGSVVCIAAETLVRAGLKTGRYTGPHLISFTERICFNGKSLSNEDFARLCSELRHKSEEFAMKHPEHGSISWFELLTAMAFVYFAKLKADASVIEVGLGGRYDASNVLSSPVVTSIVSVGFDHMQLLGESITAIAAEKAGIIKQGVPVVTACEGEALKVIAKEAKAKNSALIRVTASGKLFCGQDSKRERLYASELHRLFCSSSVSVYDSILKQKGYQKQNAAVAAAMLGIWELETGKNCLGKLDEALSSYFWPGRLQFFPEKRLILDGAHNVDGAAALRLSLDELFPGIKRCFILCFFESKQYAEILSALLRPGDLVYASQKQGRRAVVPAASIAESARKAGAEAREFDSLESALKASEALPGNEFIRTACGSFAAVTAALEYLGYRSAEDSRIDCNTLWHTDATY